jgi:uncharacterized protein YbcC (UPF0753/DUF2309 family)
MWVGMVKMKHKKFIYNWKKDRREQLLSQLINHASHLMHWIIS